MTQGTTAALIVAAGQGVRSGGTLPKQFAMLAGKPMIEYVIDNIAPIGVDCVYVVTNAKFADHFQKWANGYNKSKINFNDSLTNVSLASISRTSIAASSLTKAEAFFV